MIQRKIVNKLLTALLDSPVVLLHGARQTGKSTLIKNLTDNKYPARYITFDDPGMLSAAKDNPFEFLNSFDENLAIDEVQRAPEIFSAIKRSVDSNRKAGRFILSGSSNVLLLPKISESLAGRMEILNLYPFSQNEINKSDNNLIDDIFAKSYRLSKVSGNKNNFIKKITTGGFPEMLLRKKKERQDAWFKSYITTILQRDVRDVANIEKLSELPKLLNLFASRAGTLLNFAEISRSSAIPQTTLKRYTALLEAIFMIYFLPAWSGNLSKRLIRTPKFYLSDTGLLSHLTAFDFEKQKSDPLIWGRVLENFVLLELLKQSSWSKYNLSLFHFRTSSGQEVDFIIERSDGSLIGIEVKATASVSSNTFGHLKVFARETGKRFLRGIVFYTGNESIPFAKNMFALPLNVLY